MKTFLKFAHFLFVIICIIIQLSVIEHLKIFNIDIDIVLIAVIGIAIFDGGIFGLVYGFIAGMLLDLLGGEIIGISALLYSLGGFFTGKIMNLGFKKRIPTYVLIIFFFSEANLLVTSGLYYLFNFNLSSAMLGMEMIINPVCNILVMFAVFPLLRAGSGRSEEIGFIYKNQV